MKPYLLNIILLSLTLISCHDKAIHVKVTNPSGIQPGYRMIEVPSQTVLSDLDSEGFYVTDPNGIEIPSQLTSDGYIIFLADVPAGEEYVYKIHPSDSIHRYNATVGGRIYPERRDDIGYENELTGYRIYGPGTQNAGETAFGYDLFFKYPSQELILPQLYAAQTDIGNWAKVDSLRKIDNRLAEEFENSFTYHIDHGKGMDCYAVGPTLGAGTAALMVNDTIRFPWCYEVAEITDNGPLRFSLYLRFKPRKIDNKEITEFRKITLDAESYLNHAEVWFEGLDEPTTIVAGFPLRDNTTPITDLSHGIIGYSDPTQGDNNGRALLGLRMLSEPDSIFTKDGHILIASTLNPEDTLKYRWGFAWDKTDIKDTIQWKNYLEDDIYDYVVEID